MVIVTDFKWKTKGGKDRVGFYMDKFLCRNLLGILRYLRKAKDVVGIVSGHGKVRIGKSTMAMQIGYFIAWLLAGGQMIFDESGMKLEGMIPPKKTINFSRKENILFSPQDLMKQSEVLFNKYGKNQVIIYDEARGGLASDRAMESINKTMSEWFEQCGQYGHIIILVLPNFFKLHEDFAVARSLFLVDVFEDKEYNKGYFNFYNELQKERLYYFGKKRVGVMAKYMSANESFWGKFTSFIPVDKAEYTQAKRIAITKSKRTRFERKFIKRFYACLYVLKKFSSLSMEQIGKELTPICGEPITRDMVQGGIDVITLKTDQEDLSDT